MIETHDDVKVEYASSLPQGFVSHMSHAQNSWQGGYMRVAQRPC